MDIPVDGVTFEGQPSLSRGDTQELAEEVAAYQLQGDVSDDPIVGSVEPSQTTVVIDAESTDDVSHRMQGDMIEEPNENCRRTLELSQSPDGSTQTGALIDDIPHKTEEAVKDTNGSGLGPTGPTHELTQSSDGSTEVGALIDDVSHEIEEAVNEVVLEVTVGSRAQDSSVGDDDGALSGSEEFTSDDIPHKIEEAVIDPNGSGRTLELSQSPDGSTEAGALIDGVSHEIEEAVKDPNGSGPTLELTQSSDGSTEVGALIDGVSHEIEEAVIDPNGSGRTLELSQSPDGSTEAGALIDGVSHEIEEAVKDPNGSGPTLELTQSSDGSTEVGALIDDVSHEIEEAVNEVVLEVTVGSRAQDSSVGDDDGALSGSEEFMIIPNASLRGRDKLADPAGYTYTGRRRAKSGTVEWTCDRATKPTCCRARVMQKGPDSFIRGAAEHCHDPQPIDHRALAVICEVKSRASADMSASPSAIASECVKSMRGDDQSAPTLPTLESFQRVATHARNSARLAGKCKKRITDGCEPDVAKNSSRKSKGNQSGDDSSKNAMPVRILYQCEYCELTFDQTGVLQSHKLTCPRRELLQCEYCPATFTSFKELKGHQNIYTVEKPYRLGYCKKGFLEESNRSNAEDTDVHSDSPDEMGDDVEISRSAPIAPSKLFEENEIVSRVSTQEMTEEGNFGCEVCKKTFTQRYALKKHARTHTGIKPYECDICGKHFTQSSHMRQHKMIHTGEKPYPCRSCKETFRYISIRNKHEQRKHSKKVFPEESNRSNVEDGVVNSHSLNEMGDDVEISRSVQVAPSKLFKANELVSRVSTQEITEDGNFQCEICKKTFSLRYVLKKHARTHTGIKPYKCDVCGKYFTQSGHMRQHKMIHTGEKPYPCRSCKETFRYTSDRKRHEQRKHSKKTLSKLAYQYKCEHCDKAFAQKYLMEAHKRTHFAVKPIYHCEECDKYFKSKGGWDHHRQIHAGAFPFQCDICGKRLRARQNLERHRRTHMKATPYNCYVCGEGFEQLTNFTEHKKTHIIVKSYQCDFCGAKFRTSSHLHSHRRIHTGERPHRCEVCGKEFRRSGTLKKHIKMHAKQGIIL